MSDAPYIYTWFHHGSHGDFQSDLKIMKGYQVMIHHYPCHLSHATTIQCSKKSEYKSKHLDYEPRNIVMFGEINIAFLTSTISTIVSTIIHYSLLSTIINYYPLLSTIIHYYPLLSHYLGMSVIPNPMFLTGWSPSRSRRPRSLPAKKRSTICIVYR